MVRIEQLVDRLKVDSGWVYITWDDGREFAISVADWRELHAPVDGDTIVMELSLKVE